MKKVLITESSDFVGSVPFVFFFKKKFKIKDFYFIRA